LPAYGALQSRHSFSFLFLFFFFSPCRLAGCGFRRNTELWSFCPHLVFSLFVVGGGFRRKDLEGHQTERFFPPSRHVGSRALWNLVVFTPCAAQILIFFNFRRSRPSRLKRKKKKSTPKTNNYKTKKTKKPAKLNKNKHYTNRLKKKTTTTKNLTNTRTTKNKNQKPNKISNTDSPSNACPAQTYHGESCSSKNHFYIPITKTKQNCFLLITLQPSLAKKGCKQVGAL